MIGIGEHRGEPQLQLEILHLDVPSLEHQLETLRIVPGEIHDGVVANVVEFGIFVTVGPVSGLVHKSRLPGASTAGYTRGRERFAWPC